MSGDDAFLQLLPVQRQPFADKDQPHTVRPGPIATRFGRSRSLYKSILTPPAWCRQRKFSSSYAKHTVAATQEAGTCRLCVNLIVDARVSVCLWSNASYTQLLFPTAQGFRRVLQQSGKRDYEHDSNILRRPAVLDTHAVKRQRCCAGHQQR